MPSPKSWTPPCHTCQKITDSLCSSCSPCNGTEIYVLESVLHCGACLLELGRGCGNPLTLHLSFQTRCPKPAGMICWRKRQNHQSLGHRYQSFFLLAHFSTVLYEFLYYILAHIIFTFAFTDPKEFNTGLLIL